MREIKFRGKCIPEFPHPVAKWVYGSFVSDELILSPYKERNENRHFWYMVDPDTVGQFTGLCDANGREIYEGDIIQSEIAEYLAVVEFRKGAFVAVTGPVESYQALSGVLCLKGLRVIGNVHDSPELLEGKDA